MMPSKSKRRFRFRFGLRSLFVVMTLVCVLVAILTKPLSEARQQRRFVSEMEKLGAKVSVRGLVLRDPSVGHLIMGWFGNEYDRDCLYILDFSGTSVTDKDLARLTEVPYVHDLNLSRTAITDAGLDSIAACSNLHELNLSETQVTDLGILKLMPLKKLASLQTTGTAVSYAALTQLDEQLPWADSSEQRAIAEVQAYGAQAHGSRRYFEDAEYPGRAVVQGAAKLMGGDLLLGMNRKLQLNRKDISHLAYLESLETLMIHNITIEPGSFTDVPAMPNLTTMEIYSTDLTDLDIGHLARQTQLEAFTLYNSKQVTDAGIRELAKLRNLKTLSVKGCKKVTPASIEYLRQQLPDCEIAIAQD